MISEKNTSQWDAELARLMRLRRGLGRAVDEALREEAELAADMMRIGISEQAPGGRAFRPLSRLTIKMRRYLGIPSNKALFATGRMHGSIRVRRIKARSYHAGVPRKRVRGSKLTLDEIARIHERGAGPYAVKVTPKMRRLLGAALGRSPRGEVVIVRIPARPFVDPVYQKQRRGFEKRVRARLRSKIGI